MKMLFTAVCATLVLASFPALCGEKSGPKKQSSAEFEKMKSLVGTWKGKVDLGEGPAEATVEYRMISAGSVVEERIFAGTPHEMVTMYYDENGKLALTHYCAMGNRPAMLLKSSKGNTLEFDFDKRCGINPAKESHMHALTLRFDDADTLTMECKAYMNGKETEPHANTFKREKT